MEGKPVDYKRLAYEEYQNSKDKARYVALAQKLAQHINNLSEDKNSRIRWLWELIQNAKDVPNQFGKCRIRIQIRDDKLIFAHNGDPFRVSDLQSLVAQYSSKPEENKIQAETTGKYGTGFIVTYILSRKIRIKGLLSVKTKEEIESNSKVIKEEENVDVELVSEDQIRGSKSTVASAKSRVKQEYCEETLNQNNIEQEVQQTMPKKSKVRGFEGGSLYQRFQLYLDRQYKDRDTELYHKLRQTEQNLLDDLLKNEPEPKWQRKQGELNTQFVYEELDQAALKMISQAMTALKELFPYALLFNPKLFQIQMIDKRDGKRLKNFGIKRVQEQKYNGVNIFNANILEQGIKIPRKFSLAYMEDQDTYSTIAIPLFFEQNGIRLLQVNSKFPKIFKEFPLIGCKDTGFNFVFTSRKFYPNQSRSGLMLNHIQGRNTSAKSSANWQAVSGVFEKGLLLYKQVSKMITQGQENLLIISLENQFTLQQFADKKMRELFQRYQKDISQIKFLQFKNGSKGTLCELVFPCGKSSNTKVLNSEYSLQLNSIFSSVLGESKTFNDQWYERFYEKFDIYDKTWAPYVEFYDFNQCLMRLSELTFVQLIYKTGGEKQLAFKLLQKLYRFLLENNPLSVTQSIKETNSINFVLTNKEQFKNLSEKTFGLMLMTKKDLPSAYEEIGLYLGLSIEEYTIHDKFKNFFLKVKPFGLEEMLVQFQQVLFTQNFDERSLILLGRFMTTFKIQVDGMQVAIKLKNIMGVNVQFPIKDKTFKLSLDKKRMREYKFLFELKLMKYINKLINQNEKLTSFMDYTIFLPNQKSKCIEWLNDVYKLEASLLMEKSEPEFIRSHELLSYNKKGTFIFGLNPPATILIDKNLNMFQRFQYQSTLKVFCVQKDGKHYKGNYPNERDIQFYQKVRKSHVLVLRENKVAVQSLEIKKFILHESIKYKLPIATTYKQVFGLIVNAYKRINYQNSDYKNIFITVLTQDEKVEVLDYIYDLREEAVKNREIQFKLQVFKQLQMKAYYQYPTLTNCIKHQQNKIYAFSLIRNERELAAAREICEKFGGLNSALIELKKMQKESEKEKEKMKEKEKQTENEKIEQIK